MRSRWSCSPGAKDVGAAGQEITGTLSMEPEARALVE